MMSFDFKKRLSIKELIVHHHLGLGDHLDCNGLIRLLSRDSNYSKVFVFAKEHHFKMIQYMYRDSKKIEVISINSDKEYQEVHDFVTLNPYRAVLIVGHEFYNPSLENRFNMNCWEQFYLLTGVDKKNRWEAFYFQENKDEQRRVFKKLNPSGESYIFLHDDPSRGFTIDRSKIINRKLKIITNDPTENIFYFVDIIKKATEIHCMESSFKSLVELLNPAAKLFFHDFRGHPLGDNTAGWEIVNYK